MSWEEHDHHDAFTAGREAESVLCYECIADSGKCVTDWGVFVRRSSDVCFAFLAGNAGSRCACCAGAAVCIGSMEMVEDGIDFWSRWEFTRQVKSSRPAFV